MIKLFFDTKPLNNGHAVRGIGSYVKNLEEELKKTKTINLLTSSDADIIHYPYFDLFNNTLKINNTSTVVTIFDVIPLLYPKEYPPGIKGKLNHLRQKKMLKNVKAVITISETSKKDIVRYLDVPAEKVYPIYLSAETKFKKLKNSKWRLEIKNRYKLPERFVLYVGDINYNKNLNTLAEGCKLAGVSLVIVGRQAKDNNINLSHPENKSFANFLQNYKNDESIKRIGYVESEDLVKIYNLASCVCLASYYEGFGLSIIEAQLCKTPTIISKTQALVEITGNTSLSFDPQNPNDLSKKITLLYKDKKLQKFLTDEGYKNAKKYSWHETATQTLNVYQKVINR